VNIGNISLPARNGMIFFWRMLDVHRDEIKESLVI
jgi:hypothetical protein